MFSLKVSGYDFDLVCSSSVPFRFLEPYDLCILELASIRIGKISGDEVLSLMQI